jgi:hypothetical protein
MTKAIFVKKRDLGYFDLPYEAKLELIREAIVSLQQLVLYLNNLYSMGGNIEEFLKTSNREFLSKYLGLTDRDFDSASADKINNYLRVTVTENHYAFNYADNFFFNSINKNLDSSDRPNWTVQLRICRGIIFSRQFGELVSFPPEKMFNVGEYKDGDISRFAKKFVDVPSQMAEKADGILIQSFYDRNTDEVLFCTRSQIGSDDLGYIDTAVRLAKRSGRISALKDLLKNNKSVAFELISPEHKVVVDYGKKFALILHHVRDLKTYKTLDYVEISKLAKSLGFELPKIEKFNSFEELLDFQKSNKYIEGYVVRFADGSAIKVKTNSYFEKLKGLRALSYSNIAESILNEEDWNMFKYEKIKSEELFSAADHYRANIIDQSGAFDRFLKLFCEKIVCFSGWDGYGTREKLEAMTEFNYAYMEGVKRSLIDPDKLSRDDFRIAINYLIKAMMGDETSIAGYNRKLMELTVKALQTSAWMGAKLEELNRSYTSASLRKDFGAALDTTTGGLGDLSSDKGRVFEMDKKEKDKRAKQQWRL